MRPRLHTVLALVLLLSTTACGRTGTNRAGASEPRSGSLAAAPGFDPATGTIRVGSLTVLTGPVAILGVPRTEGARVFFEALNSRGGIAGRFPVELVVADTQYDNPTTLQKYQKLRDDVVLFAQLLGTPATNAVLPQLKADGLLASPSSLDAEWVAEENLLPVGAPYQIQFLNAATWYLGEGGGRGQDICMMAIEGPYGDAGVEGLEAAARAEGFAVTTTVRYRGTDQDHTAPLTQLNNAGCDAVFLTALPANTGPILGTAARLGFDPQWLGQSPTWTTPLAEAAHLLPVLRRSFLLVGEGPEWGDRSVPGMRQMLGDVRRFRPGQPPDLYFMFGYFQSWAVAALLEKAVELGDLSRQGVSRAQRRLGTVSFGDVLGDYTYGAPAGRNPSRVSTIFRIDPERPGGLAVVKQNFTSEAARRFDFRARS